MPTLTGTISATGPTADVDLTGDFNVSVKFLGLGNVALERSFDAGTTWVTMKNFKTSAELKGSGVGAIKYRFNCTRLNYGTIEYRLQN